MIWFLGSLLPPTGNGDFDGVVITLTYGKPGSGTAGEPSGAGGGSAQTEQNAEPQRMRRHLPQRRQPLKKRQAPHTKSRKNPRNPQWRIPNLPLPYPGSLKRRR